MELYVEIVKLLAIFSVIIAAGLGMGLLLHGLLERKR